jgi:hypothetical protein
MKFNYFFRAFKFAVNPHEINKRAIRHKKWYIDRKFLDQKEYLKGLDKEYSFNIQDDQKLMSVSQPFSLVENFHRNAIESLNLQFPLYYITTRDCFAYDLIEKHTVLNINGRKILKREYFFHPNVKPQNFIHFEKEFPDYRVGIVTYENFFSHEELLDIENSCFETEKKCFQSKI